MGTAFIPPWIIPDRESYDLVDDGTAIFRPELAPGITQRQSFGPPRWKISRQHTVRQEEMGSLLGHIMDSDGQYKTVVSKVYWNARGSFPSSELVANNQFQTGSSNNWSASAAEVDMAVSDRMMRVRRTTVTNTVTIRASSTAVTSGSIYSARAFTREGFSALNTGVRLGTTAGGGEIGSSALAESQILMNIAGAATANALHLSVLDTLTGRGGGSFYDISYASLTRVIRVNGGSQIGNVLAVNGLPASTHGLLKPRDWISVNGELKMVTHPLGSDSTGVGHLRFKPALFRSPPANAPIHIVDPFGTFLLQNLKVDNRFGSDAIVSYDLEEVYDPQ
jgi:hypothetical protein